MADDTPRCENTACLDGERLDILNVYELSPEFTGEEPSPSGDARDWRIRMGFKENGYTPIYVYGADVREVIDAAEDYLDAKRMANGQPVYRLRPPLTADPR